MDRKNPIDHHSPGVRGRDERETLAHLSDKPFMVDNYAREKETYVVPRDVTITASGTSPGYGVQGSYDAAGSTTTKPRRRLWGLHLTQEDCIRSYKSTGDIDKIPRACQDTVKKFEQMRSAYEGMPHDAAAQAMHSQRHKGKMTEDQLNRYYLTPGRGKLEEEHHARHKNLGPFTSTAIPPPRSLLEASSSGGDV